MDCSLPGFSVHGISQARILKWVAISFPREFSWPGDQTWISRVSYIGGRALYHWATEEVQLSYNSNWLHWCKSKVIHMNTILDHKHILVYLESWCMMELMFQMNRSISLFFIICVCVLVVQSCLTLCDAMNRSPPGSSVHGFLQARILEWIAIPFSTGSSWPKDQGLVFCITGRFFTIWATGKSFSLYIKCLLIGTSRIDIFCTVHMKITPRWI